MYGAYGITDATAGANTSVWRRNRAISQKMTLNNPENADKPGFDGVN
jgi:hypothetical protein